MKQRAAWWALFLGGWCGIGACDAEYRADDDDWKCKQAPESCLGTDGGQSDSGDSSTTDAACTLNACGGCSPLAAQPGSACGRCGKYECSADKQSVTCKSGEYIKALRAGNSHTCAVLATGGVRCWGSNDNGELGDGSTTSRSIAPTQDVGLPGPARDIALGTNFTCALLETGGVRCWGANPNGELGNGSTTARSTPAGSDVALPGPVQSLAADASHTCAVLETGGLRCWGSNDRGQLGDGTVGDRTSPASTDLSLSGPVESVAAGYSFTCAVLRAGGLRCWGAHTSGQLGNRGIEQLTPPTKDLPLPNPIRAVAAGADHTCAILPLGGVRCWGSNGMGQLGTGVADGGIAAPLDVPPDKDIALPGPVQAIGVGTWFSCALLSAGGVRCWGAPGLIGREGTAQLSAPPAEDIALPAPARALAVGGAHTCALLSTDAVWCWGLNGEGQLGNGSTTNSPVPVAVQGLDPTCPDQ
jgi:alpha-tubulin suppressor-like RCC1 family protein